MRRQCFGLTYQTLWQLLPCCLCAVVCQVKILHQLGLWSCAVAPFVSSIIQTHNSCVTDSQPDSYSCMCVSVGGRRHLVISTFGVCAPISSVKELSHSVPHLPLMDSRCPSQASARCLLGRAKCPPAAWQPAQCLASGSSMI